MTAPARTENRGEQQSSQHSPQTLLHELQHVLPDDAKGLDVGAAMALSDVRLPAKSLTWTLEVIFLLTDCGTPTGSSSTIMSLAMT